MKTSPNHTTRSVLANSTDSVPLMASRTLTRSCWTKPPAWSHHCHMLVVRPNSSIGQCYQFAELKHVLALFHEIYSMTMSYENHRIHKKCASEEKTGFSPCGAKDSEARSFES